MSEPKKTESFAGNVMKYSIATYLGFGISGAALIIKGVLPAESYAVPASFMAYTMSLMNVGMLGLDQSLLRFYHEPPVLENYRTVPICRSTGEQAMLYIFNIRGNEYSARVYLPEDASQDVTDYFDGLLLAACHDIIDLYS